MEAAVAEGAEAARAGGVRVSGCRREADLPRVPTSRPTPWGVAGGVVRRVAEAGAVGSGDVGATNEPK